MKYYAKIINENTKEVQIGTGTNEKYYKSIGMEKMEVEQAYNKNWYVKGYAPEEPIEEKEEKIRQIRNEYLEETDKFVSIPDFPIDFETKDLYIEYRQYLRDYTELKYWWEQKPKTFKDWRENEES